MIVKAFQPRMIVRIDEVVNEPISFDMVVEPVFASIPLCNRRVAEDFREPSIETLDHTVRLRMKGPGQAMLNAAGHADTIKGMSTGWSVIRP